MGPGQEPASGRFDPRLIGSRKIASLALLFELIDGGRFEVREEATNRALLLVPYLRSHANRLYAAGAIMSEDGAKLIIERRRQLPNEFSARDLHQKSWANLGDREAVQASLEVLTATNHCREIPVQPTKAGGQPTAIYRWNPALANF